MRYLAGALAGSVLTLALLWWLGRRWDRRDAGDDDADLSPAIEALRDKWANRGYGAR